MKGKYIVNYLDFLNEIKGYKEDTHAESTAYLKSCINNILKQTPKELFKFEDITTDLYLYLRELERRKELDNNLLKKSIKWIEKALNYDDQKDWFINDYTDFTGWFIRKLTDEKLEHCKKNASNSFICSPVEAILLSTGEVNNVINIKNTYYNLEKGLNEIGINEKNYLYVNLKLHRGFYHRVHNCVDGKIIEIKKYKNYETDIFGKNIGYILKIDSKYGIIYQILVGEMFVQQFKSEVYLDEPIKKIDEIGYFLLGSQCIILFPEDLNLTSHIETGKKYFVGDPLLS